ncbi:MAG TPA: glycosyltransferase family 2 protein [Pyrinomonadaceae bacterium]|nr:glycosyltransferase family 2 protein [Pyrinomonadaceae bacterium]
MAADLSIIIVNWNGGELLKNCLKSVAQSPPSLRYEIVIVDNASADDSVAWLRSHAVAELLPGIDIHVIENAENTGFSKANNQAIAYSQAPMLFLLNPDTEVLSGAIDTLITCLNSDERIGACGPRLLNTDGSLQHSVWPNPQTPWEIVLNGLGLWRLIPGGLRGRLLLGRHWDHAQRRSVPILFGAAVLARHKMIDEVGGLDERFHMYGEDYEWCLRITRAGWKLVFEPAAEVTHHGGQFSLQRWTTLEKLRVQMNAGFQYNRYCLSRSHNIANLLATSMVSFLQKNWFRLRGRPADAAQIVWETHVEELKRILREP